MGIPERDLDKRSRQAKIDEQHFSNPINENEDSPLGVVFGSYNH